MRAFILILTTVVLTAAEPLATATATLAEVQAQAERQRMAAMTARSEALQRLAAAQAEAVAARTRHQAAEARLSVAEEARRQEELVQTRARQEAQQRVERLLVAAKPPVRPLADKPEVERLAVAVDHLVARANALPGLLAERQGPETVVGRSGAVATVPVHRFAQARAVALGLEADHRGLLEPTADGTSWRVVGSDPGALAAGLVPVDASGQAGHRAVASTMTLTQWIAAGRAFIWPILIVAALGLVVVVIRLVDLLRRPVSGDRLLAIVRLATIEGLESARALVQAGRTPLDRVLGAGLEAADQPREARQALVEQVLLRESAALARGLPAIAVLAAIAPLLGLLGTVTGMIDLFGVIAQAGSGGAKAVSGGISEALICTQAGMLAAIPLLVAHAWLGRLADRRSQVLEEAACGVLGLTERTP